MQDKQSLSTQKQSLSKQNNRGFSVVVVLLIGLVIVVAISAGAYYFLKSKGQAPSVNTFPLPISTYQAPSGGFNLGMPTSTPLSKTDTTTDLNKDLNNTTVSSPSTDLQDLNNSASSL